MSGCKSEVTRNRNEDDDDDDKEEEVEKEKEEMNVTEPETEERHELASNERQRSSTKKERANTITRGIMESSVDADAWNAVQTTGTNFGKFRNEIDNLKYIYSSELTAKCYQLNLLRTTDDDFGEIIRNFHGREIVQPVLPKLELIENQWRTLDLWELLQSVNAFPLLHVGGKDSTLLENKEDMTFIWSIELCCKVNNQFRKVGDKLDIEEDICDVVANLLMKVEKKDMTSLLVCMQSAIIMNSQVRGSKQDGTLRTLLITEKKYDASNQACIVLEQMILNNKHKNVSWMRILCTQFIDLVVQLIVQPDYREDVLWTLKYLLKSNSEWKVADVYNLMKNGLLVLHGKQKEFHRYVMIIRNFALLSVIEY